VQKITLLFTFLITLALSAVVVIFFQDEKITVKETPKELYKVYLDGDEIGVIESKAKLEAYIDKKQEEIKNKYNVNTVYPPNNLNIQKYISYGDKVLSEEEVYNKINEVSPFTVKGYTFKIKTTTNEGEEKIVVVNVLNKDLFNNAATKVIEAFVPKEDYTAYVDGKQPEIKDIGKTINNISYSDITDKGSYISVNEQIFIDENELAKYLLFGTTKDQGKYIVKDGDTIEQISFDHKLGTQEFLIVNPEFTNANSLLFPGQEVSVASLNPLINIVVEENIIEDQTIAYETETKYDATIPYGTTKVEQEGENGIQRVVQMRQTTNGNITGLVIDRDASKTIKDPVNKVIVKGTKSTGGGTVIISPDSKWVWPTDTAYVITTYYGYRWGQLHAAIDIAGCGYGSPIRAARAGTVFKSGYDKTRGNYLALAHDNNYYTIYLHLSKKYVTEGQTVTAGQVIGAMGNSGYVVGTTGTHLHFGVHIGEPWTSDTKTVNPLLLYR
jgi:murein DD-endopeptidase MepM/ murein hydrolase activator NlpD